MSKDTISPPLKCANCKFFQPEVGSNYGFCNRGLFESVWLVEQGDETADVIILDARAGSSGYEIKVSEHFGCIRFIQK